MINNFYNKHKGRVSDVDKLTKIYTNLLDKLESKFNVDETSTGGGVSTGAFIGPLGGKDETIIKKPFAKQIGKEITGKKSISNPIGKIYTVTKKTEAKIISKKDLISELSSNSSSKLRDEGGSFDGDAWVGDEKGWLRKDELAWEGGEISDILAKMDINWTDSDLSLTDKETDKINEGWLIKSKEDKLVLSILKRVKQRLPEDAQFIDTRYGVWEEGDTVTFSLPGIKQNAKIEVKYSYSNTGSAYADIRVNGRDLPASKWVIKKLYYYFYKILSKKWEEKNIQNIESDLTDPNFAQDVFDILGDDNVNEGEKKKTKESPIHKKKWERCVKDVKEQNKKDGKDYNPYAVCTASIGYEGSIKKPHRRKEEEIEEATTHASVWGANGPPVVPIFGAKGKDHVPSRKPIFKGGKIVQKINNSGVLTEGIKESLLDEINKIKWVKGGKYVKIKDKCAKYNNQPWCSQGAIDSPLEFSDTVFESVGEISKVTGLSEEKILDKIKAKLKGVTPEQMEYNKEHGLPIWWKGSKEGFYEKMEPRKNYTGSN